MALGREVALTPGPEETATRISESRFTGGAQIRELTPSNAEEEREKMVAEVDGEEDETESIVACCCCCCCWPRESMLRSVWKRTEAPTAGPTPGTRLEEPSEPWSRRAPNWLSRLGSRDA